MSKMNTAILVIHGFAGGTYDEEDLANYLELNKDFDVFQFTLPGHAKNLSKVGYEEWIMYSEEKLKWLIYNKYTNIYLIGHSLGGVIATYLASKYTEVKKLVLAAPAFQYLDTLGENVSIKNSIKLAPSIFKTYGGGELFSRFLKLNITSTKEFTGLIKKYYECPKKIACPLLIIQGKNDDVVPISSSMYVYENVKSKRKSIVFADGVTHDVFRSKKDEEIFPLVKDFLIEDKITIGVSEI